MTDFLNQHFSFILPIAGNILLAAGVIFASFLVSRVVITSIDKGLQKIKNLDDTYLPVFKLMIQYTIYGIGGLVILNLFGVNTASIVTLVGVSGLSIGFALKDALSNVASGVLLLFLRPFKSGDIVEVNTITGHIREIGLFTTRMQTFSGVYVCVPNNLFWTSSIINYSRNKKRRVEVQVSLSYFDSLDTAVENLNSLIAEETRFLTDPAPQILVKRLDFSSVLLEVRGWVKTGEYWDVSWEMNQKIKSAVETGRLSIPVPRSEIFVRPEKKSS